MKRLSIRADLLLPILIVLLSLIATAMFNSEIMRVWDKRPFLIFWVAAIILQAIAVVWLWPGVQGAPLERDAESLQQTPASAEGASAYSQEQLIEANKVRRFGNPEWIASRGSDGKIDNSLPKTSLQRRLADGAPVGVISEHIVLTTPNLDQIEFVYSVLFNDKSWKAGAHHLFEGESPSGIGPDKVLNEAFFREQIAGSERVICIGLASTEYKPSQLETNTTLSDNRAIFLCSALFELGLVQSGSLVGAAHAMGLGEYDPPVGDRTNNQLQRAAVIVSVKSWNGEADEIVLDGIKAAVSSKGVRLENYVREDRLAYRIFEVRGSLFLPANSEKWNFSDGEYIIRDVD